MSYRLLSRCPVCDSKLKVTRLQCKRCETIIENEFELSKFAYLTKEQLGFIEVFIKSRGNIKDVEKELGVSYPTVRAKLDEVVKALGYSSSKKEESNTNDVLDMLERGEISAEQALEMMKE